MIHSLWIEKQTVCICVRMCVCCSENNRASHTSDVIAPFKSQIYRMTITPCKKKNMALKLNLSEHNTLKIIAYFSWSLRKLNTTNKNQLFWSLKLHAHCKVSAAKCFIGSVPYLSMFVCFFIYFCFLYCRIPANFDSNQRISLNGRLIVYHRKFMRINCYWHLSFIKIKTPHGNIHIMLNALACKMIEITKWQYDLLLFVE